MTAPEIHESTRPVGPLEISLTQGSVEIGVQPGTPVAETMVDALHIAAGVYDERLAATDDPIESRDLRARLVVSADLRAKLRGREPYEEPTHITAFNETLRSTTGQQGALSNIAPRLGGLAGLMSLRPAAPRPRIAEAAVAEKPRSQSSPVIMQGAEVSFLLEAMELAPDALDEQALQMESSTPLSPANAPAIAEDDTPQERAAKQARIDALKAEMARSHMETIDELRERALAIRNLYENL